MDSSLQRDEQTIAYFDKLAPEYSVERLAPAAAFINEHSSAESSLIDIGCGTGNTLEFLSEATGVSDVAGLDISATYVDKVSERLGCPAYLGSILEPATLDGIDRRFDFAVVAAVLHHLIGATRNESRRLAELAVANAKELLRPGGYLIVHEPVFHPPLAMSAVFYLKKAVTRVTGRRLAVGGYWNNIGAPVVSYYNRQELLPMLAKGRPSELVYEDSRPESLSALARPFLTRASLTLAVRVAD